MSEIDLARAVLLQAIYDATSGKITKWRKNNRPTRIDKEQAINFLSGERGYIERLDLWCSLLGINKESVISFGKRIKKGGKNGR